ncbi:MAG: hypothetical protein JF616_22650 [Fibrobacteres bacterium]|jgi:hypothetical protein|nr:hypothetical protein [Fibrobacterota bacterium]
MSPIISRMNHPATKTLALAAVLSALAACDKTSPTGPTNTTTMITLSAPAAGSTHKVGDSLEIKWTVRDDPTGAGRVITGVNIALSPDGGTNWGTLNPNGSVQPTSKQWGDFKYALPDSIYIQDLNKKLALKGSHTCVVQVQDYNYTGADYTATSGAFTVGP